MSYNGYPTRDAFHEAMREGMKRYAEEQREGMKKDPEGWQHAGCDHANGYCEG